MRSTCTSTWRATTFGIQEQHEFSPTLRELFPGAPEIKGGYMYANDKPGLGIDIDEKVARGSRTRRPGGTEEPTGGSTGRS